MQNESNKLFFPNFRYIHSYAKTCIQSQMYKTSIHTDITKLNTNSRVIKFFFSAFLFIFPHFPPIQTHRNEKNYKHVLTVISVSFILHIE